MSTADAAGTARKAVIRPEPAWWPESGPDRTQPWSRWLGDRLDRGWRAGEWDGESWMFTGDPDVANTAVVRCRTRACPALVRGFVVAFCRSCLDDLAKQTGTRQTSTGRSGAPPSAGSAAAQADRFAATHVPVGRNSSPGGPREPCSVTGPGPGGEIIGCARPRHSSGLCLRHHSRWRAYERAAAKSAAESAAGDGPPSLDAAQWAARHASPHPRPPSCLVVSCLGLAAGRAGLCDHHLRWWWNAGKRGDTRPPGEWAGDQLPYLAGHQFCLRLLPDMLRHEVLLALQHRDEPARTFDPSTIRAAVTALGRIRPPTLLAETPGFPSETARLREIWGLKKNTAAELQYWRWAVGLAHDEFRGIRPTDKTVLDLRAVGLPPTHRGGRRRRAPGVADLSTITQPWLRSLFQGWVELARPPARTLNQTLRATRFASTALAERPGGGQDPTALRSPDMSAVVAALWSTTRPDGGGYSPNTYANWQAVWFKLLDFGTRAGLLDDLAASFLQDRRAHPHPHRYGPRPSEPGSGSGGGRGRVETDEAGKAIPESVIAQLDAHLDALGTGTGVYGLGNPALTPDELHALYRTAYILLRDTGRRPNEIATLARDCLEVDRGQTCLIWDNHKSGRLRRRLPITADTAAAVRAWQQTRTTVGDRLRSRLGATITRRGDRFLFPALTRDCPHPNLPATAISSAIRIWADGLPELLSENYSTEPGAEGTRVPFDRDLIYPYAFRHSYAQRHADAGTPTDVLRELMDHRSIQTTAGYYTVSMKRRRHAVTTLAAQVVDRHGAPAPADPAGYQLRSVAVPYGGCTEPSNIKAGGRACPIRFQCAGCGYYRPDPSYLHAIEAHTAALRADRETARAMEVAAFVLDAMTEEINAYDAVAATMRTRLAGLPADERAEIENAATVLRKIRAGTHTPDSTGTGPDSTGTSALGSRVLLPLTVVEHSPAPADSGDHR
jgi:integrase